ncbi:MAG: hydantoinase/oxoprolinase family protein [Acidimicrobiia bacterium]
MLRVIGVDVGGTFTDVVVFDGETVASRKVPTTTDQSEGVAAAVGGNSEDLFLHGTTAATNTLLQEQGARVGLVTDQGFEDLIEIARQDRPSLYDSSTDRPRPLVDRELRVGFTGDAEAAAAALAEADVVVVGLIESYLDPFREQVLAADLRRELGVEVLESAVVSPEFREYERIATTVLSAYLTPSVARYLSALDARLPMERRLVMTSSGGLVPFSGASKVAGRLVLSGPAGGAVAAGALGEHHGYDSVISFDMGGTSTDVCRITGGALAVGSGHEVAGRVNRVPAVPIRTIGAGGGSIAWLDPGGALRVGPQSAGADPGPACYGRGGRQPTVTDAHLVAGNLPQDLALGGTVTLEPQAAEAVIGGLAQAAGLSLVDSADGVLEVVDSNMEHALRSVSVEEGADPRESVLVAFGGAGGLHASRLARRLGITKVLIPPLSGVFSALGLLLASPRADTARTVMMEEDDSRLEAAIAELSIDAGRRFRDLYGSEAETVTAAADVRYRGQSHELEVTTEPVWRIVRERFESLHYQRFGFVRPGEPIEVVNLRATAEGSAPMTWADLPRLQPKGEPSRVARVWRRESLPPGFTLTGPALVVETNSAVLIGGGEKLTVLDDGTLEMTL